MPAPKVHYEAEEPTIDFTPDELPEADGQQPEAADAFSQDEETAPVLVRVPSSAAYAYEVGNAVQPAPGGPFRLVIWRGQLKERRPETGLVHRTNVYRLDDGFWDCYREDELRAA